MNYRTLAQRLSLSIVLLLAGIRIDIASAEPVENPKFESQLSTLAKPTDIVGTDPAEWKQTNGNADNCDFAVVEVQGMPFDKAFQVESKKRVDRDFMIQFGRPSTGPVVSGDVMMLTFYARAVKSIAETGVGQVNVSFLTKDEPKDRAGRAEVLISTEWKKYYVPWSVFMKKHPEPVPAGKMGLMLSMGLPPQVVQIADMRVLSFPKGVTADQLPHEENTYDGRAADAAWRAPAEERIEKYRKGDLTVEVTDADGKPVDGAQVHVAMKKHAFGFGSAFSDQRIINMKGDDAERYREEFIKLFNCGTNESGLKWTEWVKDTETPEKAIDWMNARGIRMRGHNLVWPQWDRMTFLPKATQAEIHRSPEDLQKFILAHLTDEVTAMAGKCFQWDVVNEPMTHKDFLNFQGPDAIVEWFKTVHALDPNAKLIVNDITWNLPNDGPGGSTVPPDFDFYTYLKYIKDHGGPIGGVGFESHLARMDPPEKILKQLDRYAEFGSLNITEFDATVDDEQLQADMTRDYMTIAFSHPAVDNFVMWGFWDGQHWRKNAVIFRKDWSLKPSGQAYMDLVFKKWWTDTQGASDAAGQFKVRGFLGDYEISVTRDGKTVTQPLTLGHDGATVKLAVK